MDAATALQSRLIGAILVEKSLISGEQLERALQIQADTGERLGEIVVAEFGVSRLELASVLAEQWAELESAERNAAATEPDPPTLAVEPLTPAEVQIRRPIGEIFVELGFISSDQLDAALDAQRETGARIGEILVEQGSLTRLDLASALAEQWSALQKLRPPAPIVDPQPWQNGAPVSAATGEGWSTDDRAAVAALEERLRIVERAAAATPWQEDLLLVTTELRAAVGAVEERVGAETAGSRDAELEAALDALNRRIAALESGSAAADLEVLRRELAELKGRPVTVEGLADLRAVVEQLAGRPDRSPEIDALAAEVTALASRLEELAVVGELQDRLDAVAGQAEVAQTGIAGLSGRVDALAGLEGRLDDLATRLPGEEVIEELRRALAELTSNAADDDRAEQGAAIAALVARLDQVSARIEDVATGSALDLAPRIDELSVRIDEVASALPATFPDDLRPRIESLEEVGRTGSDELERLERELRELQSRTEERLADIAAREPDPGPVDELRARVDELAAALQREPDVAQLGEIRARLDELAAAIERDRDHAALDELQMRVNLLAATVSREPDRAPLDEFRSRLDELAAALEREPDVAQLDEIRARLGEVAAAVELRPEMSLLDGVRARVDELAAAVELRPDLGAVHDLRARVDELAATVAQGDSVSALELRVGEMEERFAATTPAAELRDEMRRVVESTAVERASLAEALFARVEEITATAPREDEVAELRARLDELAARPTVDPALHERVDDLASRLEGLASVEGTIADLRESLDGLSAVRADSALATESRLARLEVAIDAIAGLEARIREGDDLADRSRLLAARLDGTESRLVALGELEERVETLAAELERRPHEDALVGVATELRSELEALAARPVIADPSERIQELSQRVDRTAREGSERIDRLAEELGARIGGITDELRHRVDDLAGRADGLVHRDEAAATAAEQAAWVRDELDHLRESANARAAAVDAVLGEAEHARAAGQHELRSRIDDEVGAVRAELDAREQGSIARLAEEAASLRAELRGANQALDGRIDEGLSAVQQDLAAQGGELAARLDAQGDETAALRLDVDAIREAAAARTEWEESIEHMIDERLAALASRVTGEVATARAETEAATAALRDETNALGARIDQLLTFRHVDLEAARTASDRLSERVEALGALREEDAEAARGAAVELSERLTSLAASMRAEAAEARAAAEGVAARIGDLHGLRADDLAATELAAAELAARLDDHALQSAAAAFEVEQSLRDELGGIAARLEERDAQGIEAREELRGELERAASSVGWRLERIEESLASDDTTALRATVAELEARLESQLAMGEEQVRVTERALRKGLASLGERLVDSEAVYVDAGNALRRSIERLGAAVVEADARMADQIPLADAEGCVAFAPTASGYRLVELPGAPPELGATLELECSDGPLVVTRYGRSPLPLDGRPCAYLDRA